MTKNPFEILGLSPSAMRGIRNEQIRIILKHQLRGLQAVHHPDMGGRPERMADVNKAMEELKDPVMFDIFKKKYLKITPMQKKVALVEEELVSTNKLLSDQLGVLWNYLFCIYRIEKESNIFQLNDVYINDSVETRNFACANRGGSTDLGGREIRAGQVYILDVEDGVFRKRYVKRGRMDKLVEVYEDKKYPHKKLVGAIDDKSVGLLGGLNNLLLLLSGHSEPVFGQQKVNGRRYTRKQTHLFENRIAMENFICVMAHLTPKFSNGSLLFALNTFPEEKPFISLEGKVIHGFERK